EWRSSRASCPLRAAAPCPGLPMNTPPVRSASPADIAALRAAITAAWTLDETAHVGGLLAIARQPAAGWDDADRAAVRATATDLARRLPMRAPRQGPVEALIRQTDPGTQAGVPLERVARAPP